MEQVANLVPAFVSILIGSTIFVLVSVLCGYNPFYDLNYPKALALCGIVGVFAFLLSDMPQAMISMGKSHPKGGWPLAEQALEHITTFSSYKKLIINNFALAFVISGLIGSDFLLNLRKLQSHKTAARAPATEWDVLLWLYASTGDEVTIHLKDPGKAITGSLDFRSIGGEQQAIILRDFRSHSGEVGKYVYIGGSDISSIELRKTKDYESKTFWKDLFCNNWIYVALFFIGVITFTIQIELPNLLPLNLVLFFELLVLTLMMYLVSRTPRRREQP